MQLVQRVWARCRVQFSPISADHKPDWAVVCEAVGLAGVQMFLKTTSSLDAQTGECTAQVQNWAVVGGQQVWCPVSVDEMGNVTQENDGDWTSDPWDPDNGYWVIAQALWEINDTRSYECTQTTSHSNETLTCSLDWRLQIEDKSNPAPAFNESITSALSAEIEYGSLLMLWTIVVNKNCDNSTDDCSCTKYNAANDGTLANAQPNTP